MNNIYIEVTDDTEVLSKLTTISNDDLNKIKPLINKIKEFKPYTVVHEPSKTIWTYEDNFNTFLYLDEEHGEQSVEKLYNISSDLKKLFLKYCPKTDFGFSNIIKILIFDSPTEILLNIKK